MTVPSTMAQTQTGHHLTEQDMEQNTCQDFLLCKIHLIAEEEIASPPHLANLGNRVFQN